MSNTARTSRPTVASVAGEVATLAQTVGKLEEMLARALQGQAPAAGKAAPKATRKATRKAAPAAGKAPRMATQDTPQDTPRLKAFTRQDRKAFVAAALREGVDFREEITNPTTGKVHLQGWTSSEIVAYCLANNYCPAGWRIADGWKARVAAQ